MKGTPTERSPECAWSGPLAGSDSADLLPFSLAEAAQP